MAQANLPHRSGRFKLQAQSSIGVREVCGRIFQRLPIRASGIEPLSRRSDHRHGVHAADAEAAIQGPGLGALSMLRRDSNPRITSTRLERNLKNLGRRAIRRAVLLSSTFCL